LNGASTEYSPSEGVNASDDVSVLFPTNSQNVNSVLKPIPLGDAPDPGTLVYARGNSYTGGNQLAQNTSVAEFVGMSAVSSYRGLDIFVEPDTSQHSVPGNSGGALLTSTGSIFAEIADVTSVPIPLPQINVDYGLNLTDTSSHNYWVVEGVPLDDLTLSGLASGAHTCNYPK